MSNPNRIQLPRPRSLPRRLGRGGKSHVFLAMLSVVSLLNRSRKVSTCFSFTATDRIRNGHYQKAIWRNQKDWSQALCQRWPALSNRLPTTTWRPLHGATTELSPSTDLQQDESSLLKYHNVILFDGICNFCNNWVDVLLRLDHLTGSPKFYFAPLQSTTGQYLLTVIGKQSNDISSVVLIQVQSDDKSPTGPGETQPDFDGVSRLVEMTNSDGTTTNFRVTHYDKSRCVLKVLSLLGSDANTGNSVPALISNLLYRSIPATVRDTVMYDTVANNRYRLLGTRTECRCSDPVYGDRFILD
jgi:predicted DCC family thiol-disulfide oxidoreductase YuxK